MAATPPPPPRTNEEDLAVPKGWSDDEDDDDLGQRSDEYPPVNEDETETRRIEENLKRWEVAERMKRKVARESRLSEPQAPTLLSEVSRRASLLWTTRTTPSPRTMNPSLGTHTALNSEDSVDVVPLGEIAATPTPSPPATDENPFANPEPSSPLTNPFSDPEAAIMNPTEAPVELHDTTSTLTVPSTTNAPTRPALLAASSSYRRPPTPKPLGLPPPRAPPPPVPENAPLPPPEPMPEEELIEEETKPTRWWHEWLCGLGEGDDRGGEHQAGRTNPLE